jgi:hypothetical protein
MNLEHLFVIFSLDINECLADPCHVNGICTNTAGSYVCRCKTGFSGNGFQCDGKLVSLSLFKILIDPLFQEQCRRSVSFEKYTIILL